MFLSIYTSPSPAYQLLKRPPFRFLFDIVAQVAATTGLAASAVSAATSGSVSGGGDPSAMDKDARRRFLGLVLDAVDATLFNMPIAPPVPRLVANPGLPVGGNEEEDAATTPEQRGEASSDASSKARSDARSDAHSDACSEALAHPVGLGRPLRDALSPKLMVRHVTR